MATNQYADACEAYNRAINLNPNDPQVWCSLGVLYYAFGQYREALGMLARALRLDPKMADAWYNVGALYDMCDQAEDAQQAYLKANEFGLAERFAKVGMGLNPIATHTVQYLQHNGSSNDLNASSMAAVQSSLHGMPDNSQLPIAPMQSLQQVIYSQQSQLQQQQQQQLGQQQGPVQNSSASAQSQYQQSQQQQQLAMKAHQLQQQMQTHSSNIQQIPHQQNIHNHSEQYPSGAQAPSQSQAQYNHNYYTSANSLYHDDSSLHMRGQLANSSISSQHQHMQLEHFQQYHHIQRQQQQQQQEEEQLRQSQQASEQHYLHLHSHHDELFFDPPLDADSLA